MIKYSPRLSQYLHKFRPFHLDTSLSSDQVTSSGSVSISALQADHKFKVPFPPPAGAKPCSRVKYQQLFADNNIADKFVISEDTESDCQTKEDHHDLHEVQHLQETGQGEVLENLGKIFNSY